MNVLCSANRVALSTAGHCTGHAADDESGGPVAAMAGWLMGSSFDLALAGCWELAAFWLQSIPGRGPCTAQTHNVLGELFEHVQKACFTQY